MEQKGMGERYFLFGLLNVLSNRLQAVGDGFFDEISMKQWLTLACISIYEKPPTINEVAETMGSSHQNVKQILMKLERMELIRILLLKKVKI